MVVAHYMDLQDDTGQIDMTALRCTSCGEVVDAVILQNRSIRRQTCYMAQNSATMGSASMTVKLIAQNAGRRKELRETAEDKRSQAASKSGVIDAAEPVSDHTHRSRPVVHK